VDESREHLLPIGQGLHQAGHYVAEAPEEPHSDQHQGEDAKLFVGKNESDLPGVEADIRQPRHIESQRDECTQQEGHEPMQRYGHRPIASLGILKLGHSLLLTESRVLIRSRRRQGRGPGAHHQLLR